MSGFLIDTNVISEFAKPAPSHKVQQWFRNADPESLFVSVITLGEIRLGIENLPASTVSTADGLIAATALEYDLALVTRNVADFQGLWLTLVNPW